MFVDKHAKTIISDDIPATIVPQANLLGGWFLTTSLGGKISGILAGFWDQFDNKAVFFAISVVAAVVAGLLLFPLTKKLNKVVEEASAMND